MKITVVKANKPTFDDVIIREPLGSDIRRGLETAGLGMGDLNLSGIMTLIAHVLHECAMFDGKRLPPAEIEALPMSFFFEVLASSGLSSESIEAVKTSLGTTPPESPQV
jgi:hypothetical protein